MTAICSICLESFTPNCNIKSPTCGHVFHFECISHSFRSKPQCPICRKPGIVLTTVRLDFTNTNEMDEANANPSDAQRLIKNLERRLLQEEQKNKHANHRISELERSTPGAAAGSSCAYRSTCSSTSWSSSAMMTRAQSSGEFGRSCSNRMSSCYSAPACSSTSMNCSNRNVTQCAARGNVSSSCSNRSSCTSTTSSSMGHRLGEDYNSRSAEVCFLDFDYELAP